MNEVLEFLKQNPTFFIATVEGDQPRVRPFGFAMEYEGKLCLCTGNPKPFFAQIKANPKVELCACSAQGAWLRVSALAVPVPGDDAKKKALEIAPGLANLYSVGDGIFEIIALEGAVATFCSFGAAPRTVKL